MSTPQLRAFLDANILIRGVTLPRFPYEILRHAAHGDFIPVVSPLVLTGARLYVREFFPQCQTDLELALGLLRCELVANPSLEEIAAYPGLMRDVKDIPVAVAAIQARVDCLVSTDLDFVAKDDSTSQLRRFLRPIQPGSFLRDVMGWTSEALSAIEYRRWTDIQNAFWRPRHGRAS